MKRMTRKDEFLERFCCWLLNRIGRRALRRNDYETATRVGLIMAAGAYAEQFVAPNGEIVEPGCVCDDPDCPAKEGN